MAPNPPRTIFITGASSGIGAATALEAHQQGFQVVATGSRSVEKIPEALQCLPQGNFIYVQANASTPHELEGVRLAGLKYFKNPGTVYGFLNAGTFAADNAPADEIRNMWNVNVGGTQLMAALLGDLVEKSDGGFITSSSIVAAEQLNIPNAAEYRKTKEAVAQFILSDPANQRMRGATIYIGASPTGMTTREGELIMGMLLVGGLSPEADPTVRSRIFASLAHQGKAAESETPVAFLKALLGENYTAQMSQSRSGKLAATLLNKDPGLNSARTRLPLAMYFVTPGEVQSRVNQLLIANDIAITPETVAQQVIGLINEGLPQPGAPKARKIYSVNGADGPVLGLLKSFSN